MKYFHETFMELSQIRKSQFLDFVKDLVAGPVDVIAPVQKGNSFTYDKLENHKDLRLDFPQTVFSPKHFLLPPKEVLLSYEPPISGSYEPAYSQKDQIIAGMHPWDLAAVALLDKVFSLDRYDPHYCSRRQATTLIGIFPTKRPQFNFSHTMLKGHEPYAAADVILFDIGETMYGVEIVTERGKELFSTVNLDPASADAKDVISKQKLATPYGNEKNSYRNMPMPLGETVNARAEKCFSCASCTMVCPTCFCFSLHDEVAASLEYGLRYRQWDSCLYKNDTDNGGPNAASRLQYRIQCKAIEVPKKYETAGCVGCGRCKTACVPDIAFPFDNIERTGTEAHHV